MIKLYFNWIESTEKKENIFDTSNFWIKIWKNNNKYDKKYFNNIDNLIIDIVEEWEYKYLVISIWEKYNWELFMYSDVTKNFIDITPENIIKNIDFNEEEIWQELKEIKKWTTLVIKIDDINNREEFVNKEKIKYI